MLRRHLTLIAVLAVVFGAAACDRATTARARGIIEVDPPSLDFGKLAPGGRAALTVTASNVGNAVLSISAVSVSNDARAAFSTNNAPVKLQPGESVSLEVVYTAPAQEGPDGATLHIDSDADNTNDATISLAGRSALPCQPKSCDALAIDCGLAADGCGGTIDCGGCDSPKTCGGGGIANVCACAPETDGSFCSRLEKNCGGVTAPDNCGTSRTASCGTCASPESCGGGGTENVCGCAPEADPAFCSRLGKNCGPLTAADNCGATRTASCGTCTSPQTCAGAGVANVCGCAPESDPAFCSREGKNCGAVTAVDNCGGTRTASCGTCTSPQTCAGGGVTNVCGCTPETNPVFCSRRGKNCGSMTGTDNCGAMRTAGCGTCSLPQSCGGSGVPNVCGCAPETNPVFCARLGKNCGSVTAADNCGATRTASCGTCTAPQSCAGAGVANVCGCAPETNPVFCTRLGKNCGSLTGTDNCGAPRTAACGACVSPQTCAGGGVANVCGCAPETDPAFCSRLGKNCGPVTAGDNCGVTRTASCGTCVSPQVCSGGGVANVCGCSTETDPAFCARLGKNCGSLTGADNCGASRTASCGTCTSPQTCSGGGVANACGCAPETNPAFCSRLGKNCGSVTAADNCGASRTASCGTCASPQTCAGGGVANVCGCVPETNPVFCSRLGKNCGSVTATDNCGATRTANCGTCTSPQSCAGGGVANVCGCAPESNPAFCSRLGKNCGSLTAPDNCGASRTASCGTCASPQTCSGGGVANVCGCAPETNPAFCSRLGKNCGLVSAADNCGAPRTTTCGTCTSPLTCGGAGVANVCGCTPETNPAFCSRLGLNCGLATAADNCGVSRTTGCGTCTSPESCAGGGLPNVCGCTPETDPAFCSRQGKNCGSVTAVDNCNTSRTATCGSCSPPASCAGGGVPNVCGCTPETDPAFCSRLGKNCGPVTAPDNCAVSRTASCGTCSSPQTCAGGGVANVCGCAPETDPAFCTRLGKNCGSVSAMDNCNTSRTATCGTCTSPEICAGGGVPNVCACPVESDTAFCQRLATSCAGATGTDLCGVPRSVAPCSNIWLTKAPMPNVHGGSGFGVVNGVVTIAGGWTGVAHPYDVWAYTPASDAWVSKGTRPTVQDSSPASGVLGSFIYIAGGTDSAVHISSLWAHDPVANTWTQLASMPGGARSQLAGASTTGVFYAMGGYGTSCPASTGQYCDRLEAYTPGTGWAAKAPMSQPRGALAAAALGTEVYAAGGNYPPDGGAAVPYGTFEVYTPGTNTWTTLTPLPTPRGSLSAAAGAGKIFVVGGNNSAGTITGTLEIYDTATSTWSTGAPMPTPRNSAMAVFVGGMLYVIGGGSPTGTVGTVEAYCP